MRPHAADRRRSARHAGQSAGGTVGAARAQSRSSAHHQVVAHPLDALDAGSDLFGAIALGVALGKTTEGHFAMQRLHVDGAGVDAVVADQLGLDLGGDRGVIDIGAGGLLAADDGAAGGDQGGADEGGQKQGAGGFKKKDLNK